MDKIGRLVWIAVAITACKDIDTDWDTPAAADYKTVGLKGSVAVVDSALDRLVMLTAPTQHELGTEAISVGKNPTHWVPSADRERLFVLSRGVQSAREDIPPTLTVVDGGTRPAVCSRFELDKPYEQLTLDPERQWAVIHNADTYAENPDEILFARLSPEANCRQLSEDERQREVVQITLGGEAIDLGDALQQDAFSFTQELEWPGGARRILVVRRAETVQLVDLSEVVDHPERAQHVLEMPEVRDNEFGLPAQVVYHPSVPDPDGSHHAWLAVRLGNDTSVLIYKVESAAEDSEASVAFNRNIASIGGTATDIEFVMTPEGLKLAVLVPSRREAILIDPHTIVTDSIDLSAPYERLARITDEVTTATAPEDTPDVALLWASGQPSIAFWTLARTSTRPWGSLDVRDTEITVENATSVTDDVRLDQRSRWLLLGSGASEFRVLELLDRDVRRVVIANDPSFEVSLAPTGDRVWIYSPGNAREVAMADLSGDLLRIPTRPVYIERAVDTVLDIERGDGGYAALVLHRGSSVTHGTLAVTLLDAEEPESTDSRFFSGLLLGGVK
ncbi:MAG: hypothetical protein JW751_26810 [Polyangiaceae bacterium]|nr:hypothetical protein [Polyangiaceae bacterium]